MGNTAERLIARSRNLKNQLMLEASVSTHSTEGSVVFAAAEVDYTADVSPVRKLIFHRAEFQSAARSSIRLLRVIQYYR
jgi:hypothetical protein